jgi:hypothetical protein
LTKVKIGQQEYASKCMAVRTRCQTAMHVVEKLDQANYLRVLPVQNAGMQEYGVARDARASKRSTGVLHVVMRAVSKLC